MTDSYNGSLYLTASLPTDIVFLFSNKIIVQIHSDGEVTFGEGYTPSEAAIEFWKCVSHMNPLRATVENYAQQIGELAEVLDFYASAPNIDLAVDAGRKARIVLKRRG